MEGNASHLSLCELEMYLSVSFTPSATASPERYKQSGGEKRLGKRIDLMPQSRFSYIYTDKPK